MMRASQRRPTQQQQQQQKRHDHPYYAVVLWIFLACLVFPCQSFVPTSLQRIQSSSSSSSLVVVPSFLSPTTSDFARRHRHQHCRSRESCRLVLTANDDIEENNNNSTATLNPFQRAVQKFKARPGTYLLIPCVAACVGWITNWMAVQMIFYPIQFRGIPIYQWPEVPLGLIGWQGIVPCKTRPMAEAMVNMVTSELLTVKEVFARLDARKVSQLLAPEVPKLTTEILADVFPLKWMVGLPAAFFAGLDGASQAVVKFFTRDFLEQLTRSMQSNIDSIFDLKRCVVSQMLQDRTKLGQLFCKCGQAELDFLTNSGLWVGFLLGIIQMVVALFWDNPWSLSIGGGIVGYATNWIALKWIFEPVNPTKIGPWVFQGKFLKRQTEVAAEFSKFFANNILTAEQLWKSVLTDPVTQPSFAALFSKHFGNFVNRITRGFQFTLEPETLKFATQKALSKLPLHVPVLYSYMDQTLGLEETLRVRMEKMSAQQFERVLHPIFEEDELTLVLAGAALGFAAGLIQQGLETGAIKVPDMWTPLCNNTLTFVRAPRKQTRLALSQLRSAIAVVLQKQNILERIRKHKPFSRLSFLTSSSSSVATAVAADTAEGIGTHPSSSSTTTTTTTGSADKSAEADIESKDTFSAVAPGEEQLLVDETNESNEAFNDESSSEDTPSASGEDANESVDTSVAGVFFPDDTSAADGFESADSTVPESSSSSSNETSTDVVNGTKQNLFAVSRRIGGFFQGTIQQIRKPVSLLLSRRISQTTSDQETPTTGIVDETADTLIDE